MQVEHREIQVLLKPGNRGFGRYSREKVSGHMCHRDFQLHRVTDLTIGRWSVMLTRTVRWKGESFSSCCHCVLSHVGKDIALQVLLILTNNKWKLWIIISTPWDSFITRLSYYVQNPLEIVHSGLPNPLFKCSFLEKTQLLV